MIQLVMFPYAGSIVNPYKEWVLLDNQQFKIIQIEYDGRGRRSAFSKPVTWNKLIENTLSQMNESVDFTKDYILFGHSMGARVAADIYNKLTEMPVKQSQCLIFSGTEAFPSKNYDSILSAPIKKFNNFFFKMGGIPKEVIQEVELLELVTNYLREDLTLLNQFRFNWKKAEVVCPVLIFNGENEDRSQLQDWINLLGANCEQTIFEGDHFFIRKHGQEILSIIKKKIDETG